MYETIDELRARFLGLDAEYRALGERLKELQSARGPEAKREANKVYAELRELQERIDRVQAQLRERLAQEGQ